MRSQRTRSREAVQALAAELSKLWSLPAVWLTLGITAIMNLGLSAAFASHALQDSAGVPNVLDIGLAPLSYVIAGFVILGVLATCSEYTGGQIRTTLIAVPRRGMQLAAALLALTILVLPAATLIAASGILLAGIILAGSSAPVQAGDVAAVLIDVAGHLVLNALIGTTVGVLLRRAQAAIIVLLGYHFIAGPLLRERTALADYLPDTAGLPDPGQSPFVLLGWTVALIIVVVTVYRRRDI
ncbi:ABC transporter permease [Paenibacillus sp. 1P07SE]|uniref:ABC transporter permease n=1 Tax=Paenibacillus sp. 1P07SE TaxID=3132209 RepID=UPI0039A6E3EB